MRLHSKTKSKIIIAIIAIIMLCSFILPNYSYAETNTESGGQIFDPVSKFLVFVCDNVFQFLQETFVSMDKIEQKDGEYNYQYSPAKIFSGTVPSFDINFIEPNTSYNESADFSGFVYKTAETWRKSIYKIMAHKERGGNIPDEISRVMDPNYNFSNSANFTKARKEPGAKLINKRFNLTSRYWVYYWFDSSNHLHLECKIRTGWFGTTFYYGDTFELKEKEVYNKQGNLVGTLGDDEYAKYESIAGKLQNSIVSWYKVLRRIALVGLLSVLLYIGIRIVTNSISKQDNSKYKKMLTDWLVAMCLLFTLHYLMSLIIVVVGKISSVFSMGITDPLLNDLRANIFQAKTWSVEIAKVIMYIVLTIYTVMFTFQYIKRVIFMAFFTMIAPLITLTYPLDKINDGQAQAFTMWIREYIFNALLQVIHILLYFVLVSSAEVLVIHYPLIGIVTVGFITQAEKIIRKMFGFENTTTVGTIEAAAIGGLIMSGLNKLKSGIPNGNKATGGGSADGTNNGVRTASVDPLKSLKDGSQEDESPQSRAERREARKAARNEAREERRNAREAFRSLDKEAKKEAIRKRDAERKAKRDARDVKLAKKIKGVKALGGRYGKPALGKAAGLLGGMAGGAIGFAAGASQGEIGKALGGFAGGFVAGKRGGQGATNAVLNVGNKMLHLDNYLEEMEDTYNEEALGKEEAENIKFDREFKKSSAYINLQTNSNFSEHNIDLMLSAGITDEKVMTKILTNIGNGGGSTIEDEIGYYQLAKDCPDSIFYNKDNSVLQEFITVKLKKANMSTSKAKDIADGMARYK